MDEKTEKIVDQVTEKTDLSREEVLEEIGHKQEELDGFVTERGAAQIVARDHDVILNVERPSIRKLKVKELSPEMSNVRMKGELKQGLILTDDTGEIPVVVNGDNSSLEDVKKGDEVIIVDGRVKKEMVLHTDTAKKIGKVSET